MEHKVDLERVIVADLVKSSASKRYTKTIYTLTALSSIALGALVMALFYHWNEIEMIGNRRLETQDVKEVIRLTDVLLAKQDANAANIEKLLTMLEHRLRPEQTATEGPHFESNLTFKLEKDSSDKDNDQESVAERIKSTEVGNANGEGSPDDNRSSESFQWKWSFPAASAWLKLSPYGINYGTSDDDGIVSKEQE